MCTWLFANRNKVYEDENIFLLKRLKSAHSFYLILFLVKIFYSVVFLCHVISVMKHWQLSGISHHVMLSRSGSLFKKSGLYFCDESIFLF